MFTKRSTAPLPYNWADYRSISKCFYTCMLCGGMAVVMEGVLWVLYLDATAQHWSAAAIQQLREPFFLGVFGFALLMVFCMVVGTLCKVWLDRHPAPSYGEIIKD